MNTGSALPEGAAVGQPCIACGSETAHRLVFRKHGCSVLRCGQCGLGHAETGDFDPEAYYTRDYFDGGHSDGYADYTGSEPVLRREFARLVARLRLLHPNGGRLLEIGCAYGFFLREARLHFEAHGIEISRDAVDACHAAGLSTVRRGTATAAEIAPLAPLDAIVLLDVIEHLQSPLATLEPCARALAPGGTLTLTTGDFGSLLARLAGRSWRLMTPPQHLWFFTTGSVQRIAARLGLEVVEIVHPWKVVPLSLALYQATRALGLGRPRAPTGLASRLGVPVNLFDAMRVVMRRPSGGANR